LHSHAIDHQYIKKTDNRKGIEQFEEEAAR
jgi:hypothetical protein